MNEKHLNYIENKVFELLQVEQNNLTVPTMFEYYVAYKLSKETGEQYNVYKDISPQEKVNFNYPKCDKGVDITEKNIYKYNSM
jgi:hypothetical protein